MTRIIRNVFTFVAYHDADVNDAPYSLEEALERCEDGDMVGGCIADDQYIVMTEEELKSNLIAVGNDGTFFDDVC